MTHDCLNRLNWAISGHRPDKGANNGPNPPQTRQTRHEPDTGVWERLNNADSNPVEFDGIRNKAGVNSFTRYFSKPQPLRTLEVIRADIKALEEETEGLLSEIVGDAR
jgi:hypothetical protein